MSIGLPAGRGLCQPFKRALSGRPKHISLGAKGGIYQAFADWQQLLHHVATHPTHVKELRAGKLTDVG